MNWFQKIRQFLAEVMSELKKTTWPGKKEVYGTTLVVIVTVLICSAFLWVVDVVLSKAVDLLFGSFSA